MKLRALQVCLSCLGITLLCLLPASRPNASAQESLFRSQTVQPHPVNLNFEQGVVGQAPAGWNSPTKINYEVELTEEKPKSGRRSALLRSGSGAAAGGSEFGNLMQTFEATPFQGRRVRFRGAVRVEASEQRAHAQLWMRIDRDKSKIGFFGNTGRPPTVSNEWQYFEIIGDVEEDAVVINIGMILSGKGKAWLDDVSFEDLGKVIVLAEPARALTSRGLENLVAFTRLLGYVRHFHPSDEAAATDWNTFAVKGVQLVEDAQNAADLAHKLEDIFQPIAPTVRVFLTGEDPRLPPEVELPRNESSLKVISWRHKGFGQSTAQDSLYKSERVSKDAGRILAGSPTPQKPFITSLGGGISCLVPLALFADAKGTLPHVAVRTEDSKAALVKYSGNDRATRLADVALAWNIFQHFYPYFDVAQTDWQQALGAALIAAANDLDERAFLRTLRRMVALLHDGHGGVYHPSDMGVYTTPALFGWIEGRLVITHVAAEGAEGLQPGDIVLKVEGKPSLEVLTEKEVLISGASPQWRRVVALRVLNEGPKDSQIRLDVQTQSGQSRSVILRRNVEDQTLREERPPKVHEIRPGIFYLDLCRINDGDFQGILPRLEKANGVIFDLRGYPRVSPVVISHLIDKPVNSARWNVPIITAPDHTNTVEYDTGGRWTLEPKEPRLKAKIAFLTDGRAISYAESYMGIIEAYKLAEIIGEPTAGTNGDVNPFTLPGNYRVVWTGMKVLKHDGSQHHRVGIHPTVPVSRTIRGVAEKRDEQLERAIAIVSK
jgi:C-terminal processing protease CtpA/Prc